MNSRSRFLIRALAGLAFTLSPQLGAQSEIELEGAMTQVDGTKIELFDGLVSVEVLGAKIHTDDEAFINISDLKVGATTSGSLSRSRWRRALSKRSSKNFTNTRWPYRQKN